jgi:hypothetical protein
MTFIINDRHVKSAGAIYTVAHEHFQARSQEWENDY